MFGEDAKIASQILGIALTSRSHGKKSEKVPLAGVPYHAAERYLAKLLEAGQKVVVCEQTEEASPSKKLVNREVVEIITPGTITVEGALDSARPNYLASLYPQGQRWGLAFLELSTGEFKAKQAEQNQILERLKVLQPSEILIPKNYAQVSLPNGSARFTEIEAWKFDLETARQLLQGQFQVSSLDGFGCQEAPLGIIAAGAILDYLKLTKKAALVHINKISVEQDRNLMFLDSSTIRNLELFPTEGRPHSLFSILDQTKTAMGSRLLRSWMTRPLLKKQEIQPRLDVVDELVQKRDLLTNLREKFKEISDLTRLAGKLGYGKANPRDLLNLKNSLGVVPEIKNLLTPCQSELISSIRRDFPDCSEAEQVEIGR